MPKTITVFGATGHQGGAVAKALARDKDNFVVRGITRDVQQEVKVDDLKNSGVMVIQCDFDSVDSIKMAIRNSDGCFVVTYTDFNEPNCIKKEKQQGENIAIACRDENIPHVVYSTQLHTTEIIGTEVRHFVPKAEIETLMTQTYKLPVTSFLVPCYYENFYDLFKPKRENGNTFVLEIPMGITPLDLVSVDDIGEVARTVFLNKGPFLGKTLSLSGSKLTIKEIAAVLSKYLRPLHVRDKPVTVDQYKHFGKPWSVDFGNMFDFFLRHDQRYQLEHTKEIHRNVQTFDQWVSKNASCLAKAIADQ